MILFWLCKNPAGSIASILNIPFDVAKSRIQKYSLDNAPSKYKSCIQTILLVQREEGTRALFQGLVPKLLRFGPGNKPSRKTFAIILRNFVTKTWFF